MAQIQTQTPPTPHPDVSSRIEQLEAETQLLKAEIQWLQENPIRLPAPEAAPVSTVLAPPAPPADAGDFFTLKELQGEMKKLVWKKGDFTVTPYGSLWGNMVYSTQRTYPGSYTLWVLSDSTDPEGEFVVDARNTRLGLDVTGPRLPIFNCAQTGGKVEIDFQNSPLVSSTGVPSTENKATLLLRHAYAEVKNEEYRLLFGQTWDVISPLIPNTLLYTVGWDAGNMGYRRAQLRGERYLAFSDTFLTTAQLSLNQQVFEDATTTIIGEPSSWPIIEGRVAWTLGERGKGALPITFGMSGHIGEEQFDHTNLGNNFYRRTWSGNLDLRVPISERLGFQAECFTGENLGAFLGGIGQGIDSTNLNTIRSHGGWVEVWYFWTPRFHSHVGYFIDDPNDHDLHKVGEKSYNQFYFGNLVFDVTKQLLIGLEVSSWKTLYVGQLPGDSVRTEFVVKYGF